MLRGDSLEKRGVKSPLHFATLAVVPVLSILAFSPTESTADEGTGVGGRLAVHRASAAASHALAPSEPALPVLPPLPQGVAELKFSELFKTPVGPRGLEITDKLRDLNGKRVRILGYMVTEAVGQCNADPQPVTQKRGRKAAAWFEASVPGRMLLCPTEQIVHYGHYGLCDSLPPQTLFVTVPEFYGQPVPFTPGLMLLTGTLEVGQKTEPDGRISTVRLLLDEQPPVRDGSDFDAKTASTPATNKTPNPIH